MNHAVCRIGSRNRLEGQRLEECKIELCHCVGDKLCVKALFAVRGPAGLPLLRCVGGIFLCPLWRALGVPFDLRRFPPTDALLAITATYETLNFASTHALLRPLVRRRHGTDHRSLNRHLEASIQLHHQQPRINPRSLASCGWCVCDVFSCCRWRRGSWLGIVMLVTGGPGPFNEARCTMTFSRLKQWPDACVPRWRPHCNDAGRNLSDQDLKTFRAHLPQGEVENVIAASRIVTIFQEKEGKQHFDSGARIAEGVAKFHVCGQRKSNYELEAYINVRWCADGTT